MRLSPELKEQLQRIANRERRSLTNLVEKVLVEFVERAGEQAKAAEKKVKR